MAKPFAGQYSGLQGCAVGALAVAPSDAADLSSDIRAITLGVGGVLVFDGWDGVTYTTGILPAGTYPLFARRIRSTGTTATGMTGWI